jgi:4-amino-4-deoxychorismate lyase
MNFIESIKVVDGVPQNLELHAGRASRTIYDHFGIRGGLPLQEILHEARRHPQGLFKMRILYSKEIISISSENYQPRNIRSLKIVEGGIIEYSYKYEDRSSLSRLLEQKGECDDILIVKDGFVTDTSYSNVVFGKGGKLFTPSAFLLNGVKREFLLKSGFITQIEIKPSDIAFYDSIYLINSMLDLYPVERVVF